MKVVITITYIFVLPMFIFGQSPSPNISTDKFALLLSQNISWQELNQQLESLLNNSENEKYAGLIIEKIILQTSFLNDISKNESNILMNNIKVYNKISSQDPEVAYRMFNAILSYVPLMQIKKYISSAIIKAENKLALIQKNREAFNQIDSLSLMQDIVKANNNADSIKLETYLPKLKVLIE